MNVHEQINKLKSEKNALVLAHYYQTMDIQNAADIVGDSFELARRAALAESDIIVLCGVRFMAESAKILNPDKKVLLPVFDAGCPMADMITPEDVLALRGKHPDAKVMCYVNSSAAVKAVSDVCCTSSSALKIAKALDAEKIIFVPDKNLGSYVAEMVPEKQFVLFDGYCIVHHQLKAGDVTAAKNARPGALVLTHPECTKEVRDLSDFIGSTAQILDYVLKNPDKEYLICTERGVVERLAQLVPDTKVFLVSPKLTCKNMKKTFIGDLLNALQVMEHEIQIRPEELSGARATLDLMVEMGK